MTFPLRKPDEQRSSPVRGRLTSCALEERAYAYLEDLGRACHSLAKEDPVYALFQVATDFRCMARGYRDLYRRRAEQ